MIWYFGNVVMWCCGDNDAGVTSFADLRICEFEINVHASVLITNHLSLTTNH